MNERASCANCVHRRPIHYATPDYTVCHYLLDSGEVRGCTPQECVRWQSKAKSFSQWIGLLERIKEVDSVG